MFSEGNISTSFSCLTDNLTLLDCRIRNIDIVLPKAKITKKSFKNTINTLFFQKYKKVYFYVLQIYDLRNSLYLHFEVCQNFRVCH